MPETRLLQCKLSPARIERGEPEVCQDSPESELKPVRGHSTSQGQGQAGPELSLEEEGAGTLGDRTTDTSAARS